MELAPETAAVLLRNLAVEVSADAQPHLVLAALKLIFPGPLHFVVLGPGRVLCCDAGHNTPTRELELWLCQHELTQPEFRNYEDRELFLFPLPEGVGGGFSPQLTGVRLRSYVEFFETCGLLLQTVPGAVDPLLQWTQLREAGLKAGDREDWPSAAVFFQAALNRVRSEPDLVLAAAKVSNDLAIALWRCSDTAGAKENLQDSIRLFEMDGPASTFDLAASLNDLGSLSLAIRELDNCPSYFMRAIELLERVDVNHPNLVPILCNASYYYHNTEQTDKVKILMQRAGQISDELGPTDPKRFGYSKAVGFLKV